MKELGKDTLASEVKFEPLGIMPSTLTNDQYEQFKQKLLKANIWSKIGTACKFWYIFMVSYGNNEAGIFNQKYSQTNWIYRFKRLELNNCSENMVLWVCGFSQRCDT